MLYCTLSIDFNFFLSYAPLFCLSYLLSIPICVFPYVKSFVAAIAGFGGSIFVHATRTPMTGVGISTAFIPWYYSGNVAIRLMCALMSSRTVQYLLDINSSFLETFCAMNAQS